MIKKIFIKISFLLIYLYASNAYSLEQKYHTIVNDLISDFKSKNIENISNRISFPLRREFPIYSIKTKEEFKKRFDQIFDPIFIKMISNSDIDKDWDDVGWRGIMFNNGKLWIDSVGRIEAVPYQSDAEKELKLKIIENDKKNIDPSINVYSKPSLLVKTKTHIIRIDDMGEYKFRYVSWAINKNQKEKPDLIIFNGNVDVDYQYIFKNGVYKYEVNDYRFGVVHDSSPPANIRIYKNEKVIFDEDAIEFLEL